MTTRVLIAVLLLWGNALRGGAQGGAPAATAMAPPLLPVRLPPSPTAAAFERYALMPVNEASGTPSVVIPLHEARSGQLPVALSLSYHASGVRVTDVAPWVGLGWALNAGGTITRVVRGNPDEKPGGFQQNYANVPPAHTIRLFGANNAPAAGYTALEQISKGQLDYEPDLYTYNIQGRAGCFMLGNDQQYHPIPQQPLLIAVADSGFSITDEHGTQYWFADREYTENGKKVNVFIASAWHLSRIVSADKADTVRFLYDKQTLHTFHKQQQLSTVSAVTTVLDGMDGGLDVMPQDEFVDKPPTETTVLGRRLRRILFRGGSVHFQVANRLDTDEKALQAFHVVASDGDTVRTVTFYRSYFNADATGHSDAKEYLRLRLDSVATTGKTQRMPAHAFAYAPVALPNRLTGPRDYWGYANGRQSANGMPELLPRTLVQSLAYRGPTWVGGADRRPNPAYVQAGVLTQITYPTGGRQQFYFEHNTIAQEHVVPNPRFRVLADTTGPNAPGHVGGQYNTSVKTFRIVEPVAWVRYQAYASGAGDDLIHDLGLVTLTDLTANRTLLALRSQFDANYHWEAAGDLDGNVALEVNHTYRLTVQASGAASANCEISYESAVVRKAWQNDTIGGIRLREQRLQANQHGPVTIKRYAYQAPGEVLSSGYLLNQDPPRFSRQQVTRTRGPGDPNCVSSISVVCNQASVVDITYTVVSSASLGELEGLDQIVGYQTVTVADSSSEGDAGGLTVSTYSTHVDNFISDVPYPPKVLASWQRNQLLSQRVYARANNKSQLVAKTYHDYTDREGVTITGLHSVPDATFANALQFAEPSTMPFAYVNTEQTCGWSDVSRTRQYLYATGDTASYQLTTTQYWYDTPRHQQPTRVETQLANGQQQVRSRYAADYDTLAATTPTAQAVRELLRTHQVAKLLEQTTLRIIGPDTLVTAGALTLPRVLRPRVVVDAQQLRLRLPRPRALSQFVPARLHGGAFAYDGAYEPAVSFDRYDAQAQLVQYHTPGARPVSSQLEQSTGQAIALAQGASYAQVACTSFEQGELGRWHTAKGNFITTEGYTGRASYRLGSAALAVDGMPAATYQFTCWTKQGGVVPTVNAQTLTAVGPPLGGWQRYQGQVVLAGAGTVLLAGDNAQVDEVRLHPVGTPVSTATYAPLVGMRSQTDAAGRTTRYEYDALGRLLRTRDEQGRILSQQQYHYAGH